MRAANPRIYRMVVGPLQTNCYLVACPETSLTAIVDPGGEPGRIEDVVSKERLRPHCIINTHCHPDHTAADAALKAAYRIPLWVHEDEDASIAGVESLGDIAGLPIEPAPVADRLLTDGETIRVGELSLEVIHTPGHTRGSICLLCEGEGGQPILFTGDTVFAGSVGRTDLPGGSAEALETSIAARIAPLQARTRVLPGHGPETTIEYERRYNPFFRSRGTVR